MVSARVKKPLLAAIMISLGGCVSVLPDPGTPDVLYDIDPAEQRALSAHIIVRQPDAPSLYAGQALVSEDETGALRLLPSAEWAGSMTRQLQLALVDSFAPSADGTAMLPEAGTFAPYELSVRVIALNLRGRNAMCETRATVIQQNGRLITAQQLISETVTASDDTSLTRARALKSAAEACVASIAAFAADALSD